MNATVSNILTLMLSIGVKMSLYLLSSEQLWRLCCAAT